MKLSDLADIQTGLVLARKEYKGKNTIKKPIRYKQLNLRSVTENGCINTDALDNFYANEPLKTDYLTRIGDVVVRLSNPYTAVLITKEIEGLVVSSNFVIIRVKSEYLLSDYLAWYLNTNIVKTNIHQNVTSNYLATIKPSFFSNMSIKPISIQNQNLLADIRVLSYRELELLDELKNQKQLYYNRIMDEIQYKPRKDL